MYLNLTQAVTALKAGEVIAYPTEGVYGLGALPNLETAVKKILELKQRPIEKGLILVAANIDQLSPYIDLDQVPAERLEQVFATWPGPYTWIFPIKANVPIWIRGSHNSVAVRVSKHPIVRELCLALDSALISTSANKAGMPALIDPEQVRICFAGEIAGVFFGALGELDGPTPIRDVMSSSVIR